MWSAATAALRWVRLSGCAGYGPACNAITAMRKHGPLAAAHARTPASTSPGRRTQGQATLPRRPPR
eukprot:7408742-Alexandrium_andersonii.AAC.1